MRRAHRRLVPLMKGKGRQMRSILCVILIAASGFLFWQATMLRAEAALYPMIVTGGALLFTISYLVQQTVLRGDGWSGAERFVLPRRALPRVAVFAAIWSGYVLALPVAGFMVASWLALWLSLVVVRGALRWADALGSAAFTLVLSVLMKVVLYIPVPQGWLDIQLEIFIFSLR